MGMMDKNSIAKKAAQTLLNINAVHLSPDEPFTLTSGKKSPVYVDCRKIISFPKERSELMGMAESMLLSAVGEDAFDSVAGGETAGVPFAAWMAERLESPMQYIRKEAKGCGRGARIEGHLETGARVLLVEDLATDGGSKISFIDALREADAQVEHCFVVFFYDIFPTARQKMEDAGVELHYLTTWRYVLDVAAEEKRLTKTQIASVESFFADPDGWRMELNAVH